jgi:L-ascorbate metabolism protein UlaG (beta-lactamase superfamily)
MQSGISIWFSRARLCFRFLLENNQLLLDPGLTIASSLDCRLQPSAEMLACTSMPIKEIACSVGYGHCSSFMRVDPDAAVQIMEDLGAVRAAGIHWGIFQLTDEAWGEPPKLLLQALRRRGISPHLFPAGEPGLQYEATSMG